MVTDGSGMTLYLFTKDTKGTTKSACTGACLSYWPPALLGSSAPKLTGVTGTVGSSAAAGGGKQVTLNGWPLYYYAQDKAAGDVLGQGVMNIWWVVSPSGSAVHVSVWDTEEHAKQLDTLKEMVVIARGEAEAAGATFQPVVNYPIGWTI